MLYADTSALVRLVLSEPESPALRDYLRSGRQVVTSSIAITELTRATRRTRPDLEHQVALLLSSLTLVDVDRAILGAAGVIEPASVHTLDAIHLATARILGPQLEAFVTYDTRMVEAARDLGLTVDSPA